MGNGRRRDHAEGESVTYDLKADRNAPTAVGTREMAEAIVRKLGE
jgi:isocitrate dehydrogenase (NAD+)